VVISCRRRCDGCAAVLESVHRRPHLHVEHRQRRRHLAGDRDEHLERHPGVGIDRARGVEPGERLAGAGDDEGPAALEPGDDAGVAVLVRRAEAVLVLGQRVAVDLDQVERRQRIDALEIVVADAEQQRHAGEVVHEVGRR
jgi:hypothetical protein